MRTVDATPWSLQSQHKDQGDIIPQILRSVQASGYFLRVFFYDAAGLGGLGAENWPRAGSKEMFSIGEPRGPWFVEIQD